MYRRLGQPDQTGLYQESEVLVELLLNWKALNISGMCMAGMVG